MGITYESTIAIEKMEQICAKQIIKEEQQKKQQSNESIVNVEPSSTSPPKDNNDDQSDREEGEIVDDFEDIISSDEEFNLRQRIEELEARNLELEKIAALSTTATTTAATLKSNDYDYSNKGINNSGKSALAYIDLVDDDDFILDIDPDQSYQSYRTIGKSKKSSRRQKLRTPKHERRKKYRKNRYATGKSPPPTSAVPLHLQQQQQQSRQSTSTTSRNQQRSREIAISSDDNDHDHNDRDGMILDPAKLRAALRRDTRSPSYKNGGRIPGAAAAAAAASIGMTSLKRKLLGIKKTVSAYIDEMPYRELEKDDFGHELLELLDDFSSDQPPKKMHATIPVSSAAAAAAVAGDKNIELESISLEEQELRLIALKSAIVKKHEDRKQRKKVNEMRPYSPTDNDNIIIDLSQSPAQQEPPPENDGLEFENMEISPVMSPISLDKSLLPVDMELVSSDDSSVEPFFIGGGAGGCGGGIGEEESIPSMVPPQQHYPPIIACATTTPTNWMPIQEIPLPPPPMTELDTINPTNFAGIFPSIHQTLPPNTINTAGHTLMATNDHPVAESAQMICVDQKEISDETAVDNNLDDEEELALRTLLLAKLNSPKNSRNKKSTETKPTNPSAIGTIDSIDTDAMRHELLTSINKSDTAIDQKENQELNLPKITLNLKDAVKRIKTKYSAKSPRNSNLIVIDLNTTIPKHQELIESNAIVNDSPQIDTEIPMKNVPAIRVSAPSEQPESKSLVTNVSTSTKLTTNIIEQPPVNDQLNVSESIPIDVPKLITTTTKLPSTTTIKTATATATSKPTATKKHNLPLHNTNAPSAKIMKLTSSTSIPSTSSSGATSSSSSSIAIRQQQQQQQQQQQPSKQLPTIKTKVITKSISQLLTSIPMKPVNQLIIQLRESDSSSDELTDESNIDDEDDDNDDDSQSKRITNELDRIRDNESPLSIQLDSPIHSPASPASSATVTTTATASPSGNVDQTAGAAVTSDFQEMLDSYLKSARSKIDEVKTGPKVIKTILKGTKTKKPPKPVTPLAVRHLPASAQLEYRNLINRMNLLERQKLMKPSNTTNTTNSGQSTTIKQTPIINKPSISVTIDNDLTAASNVKVTINNNTGNRIVQTGGASNTSTTSSPSPSLPSSSATNKSISLVKQVLVRNVSLMVQAQDDMNRENGKQLLECDKSIIESMEIGTTEVATQSSCTNGTNVEKSLSLNDNIENTPKEHSSTENQKDLNTVNTSDESNLNAEALAKAEVDYTEHSTAFLNDLNAFNELLCRAQTTKQKQIHLKTLLNGLQVKMQKVKQLLQTETETLTKLYPTITASHQHITSDRIKSMQLTTNCNRFGRLVHGDNYKLDNNCNDLIGKKLKIVSNETKKLKSMRNSVPLLQPNQSTIATVDIHKNTKTTDVQVDQPQIIQSNINTQNEITAIVHKTTTETMAKNITATTTYCSIAMNTDRIDRIDQSTQYDANDAIQRNNEMIDNENDGKMNDDGMDDGNQGIVCKYQSPLDHLHIESSNNPNAILCRFDLMGKCEDKECAYKHLTHAEDGIIPMASQQEQQL